MMVSRLAFLFFLIVGTSSAQKLTSFEVDVPAGTGDLEVPVSVSLNGLASQKDGPFHLVEITGGKRTDIPFQVEQSSSRSMYWFTTPDGPAKKRQYEIVKGAATQSTQIQVVTKDGAMVLGDGKRNFVSYFFETVYPPQGVDSAYARSGFIHPLWAPHGQELTRIQPKDHYHHYGIWNPWTHVLYKGDTVDFWNIGGKQGTVKFKNFSAVAIGPLFSGFDAFHDHIAFKNKDTKNGEVAIKEKQTIRAYIPLESQEYYLLDITSTLECATANPVVLLKYRYGGLGWRATGFWDRNNSEVLSSDGKTRKDADGSKARWCIVQGDVGGDYAGALMMSHPDNYNHPEPLRIWPENQYDRGDMFANFSPTKDMDWTLVPGKTYVLKYRLLVYNGHMTNERAEKAWQTFAKPLKVTVKPN